MLNAMREGAKSGIMKFIFFGLMSLATFGLVLTDAGGFFGSGFGRQTIAKVGDIEMTLPVFNQIYSRELTRNNIPPEVARAYGIPQMTLGREINRLAFLQAAQESKLRVGDSVVAMSIKKQLNDANLSGTDEEKLQFALRQMNMSEAALAQMTRDDITASLVNVAAVNTGKAIPAAVEALYRYEKEKRIAQIITITPSDVSDVQLSNDDDALAYYTSNQVKFTEPEKRSINMLHMTTDVIGRDITIDEAMVVEFYETNKAEYRQPDQYRFEQTILDNEDDAKKVVSNATTGDANALKTAGNFVKADWYGVDSLPSELNDAITQASVSDVIGPIETSIGFHVVRLIDIKKDSYTPFEEAKSEITTILRDKEIDAQIYNLADDLDNAVADGLGLDDLSKQYNVTLKTIANVESNGTGLNVSDNENDTLEIVEMAFAIEQEEISPVIELRDGSFALIEINAINEEAVKPFDTVKADIKKVLDEQRKQMAVQTKATNIMAAFNKGEATMSGLARQNNVSYSQTRAILRTPQDGVAVTTDQAGLLFSLTPKNDISSLRVGNDVKIIRLAGIETVQSIPTSGDEVAKLKENVAIAMDNEIQQQFANAWKEELGVNINTDLFQQAFLSAPEDDQ